MASRGTWFGAGLLVASSLVALVACELLVRVVAPQDTRIQSPGMYQRDSAAGYHFTHNYSGEQSNRVEYRVKILTDANGLRVPATGPGPTRPLRAILIGDSFVFGQGVEAEDALPAQLERQLTQRGFTVSVLNAGVPGYSTRDELAWLKQYGLALHPDLIILGVYLGNDLQDNRIAGTQRFQDGTVANPPFRWQAALSQWAFTHLHLYALVRKVALSRSASRQVNGMRADVAATVRRFTPVSDTLRLSELAATNAAVAGFDSLLSASGVHGLAALLPEALQVEPSRRERFTAQLPGSVKVNLTYANDVFSHALDEHHIPWIDLTDPLRAAAASGTTLYYPVDGHWNRAGNTAAAGALADAIAKRADVLLRPAGALATAGATRQ